MLSFMQDYTLSMDQSIMFIFHVKFEQHRQNCIKH